MSNQPTLPETNPPSSSKMDIDPPTTTPSTKKPPKKSKKRTAAAATTSDSDTSSSDTEKDLINIDFEFFDPLPHDFHGIKLLLRQLFDADSQLLDLSALTDLILDQKLVGSTVKVDGREGDPYSFLSVVNLGLHFDTPAVKSLVTYLHSQSTSTPLHELLTPLFTPSPQSQKEDGQEETRLAIILSERLINMPPDISPPSYKMLLEEITYAVEDNEPYNFTHYLLLSKVYTEIESSLPPTDSPPPSSKRLKHSSSKKSKSKSKNNKGLIFNFHPEDDIFLNNSIGELTYKYKHEPPEESADSKRAFQDVGILPRGRMVLMTKEGFEKAVEGL
ncbi:Mss4p nuclear export [Orbilia oligospora]|uniref:Protein BCP1 n=1 Tax=Orbilia oligospora TaxID=2813651 RepID=A0A7C8K4N5_ORBOL|nr:Mss4p nuclear export [Orbilia oligospora]